MSSTTKTGEDKQKQAAASERRAAPLLKHDKKQQPSRKWKRHTRFQSEPPAMSSLFSSSTMPLPIDEHGSGDIEEEAEGHLLKVLEERRARAQSRDAVANWDASVEGESPPLRRVSFHGGSSSLLLPHHEEEEGTDEQQDEEARHKATQLRFQNLVKQVHSMHSKRHLDVSWAPDGQVEVVDKRSGGDDDERQPDAATEVFEGVGGEDTQIGKSAFAHADTNTDMVISAALNLNDNLKQDDETASMVSDSVYSDASGTSNEEMLPLVGESEAIEERGRQGGGWFGWYGSEERSAARRARKRSSRRKWRRRKKRCVRKLRRTCRCDKYWFADVCHPISLAKALHRFVTASFFIKLGLPSLIAAFILFYYLRNPTLDFIEKGTISWWLVFLARQTLTFQLAIMTESIVIDGIAMKSRVAVQIFGPLLTLTIISAKGWPFLATAWALWDLTILHGDDAFEQNWLFWTDIELFSPANRGGSVIYSDLYLRVLLAMLMAGVATAVKRTVLALHFGKSTVLHYKPRMLKILADMAVISQVGEIASESENLVAAAASQKQTIDTAIAKIPDRGPSGDLLNNVQWKEIDHIQMEVSSEDDDEDQADDADNAKVVDISELRKASESGGDVAGKVDSTKEVGNDESLTSSGDEDDGPDDEDDESEDEDNDEEEDAQDSDSDSAASDGRATFEKAKKVSFHTSSSASISKSEKRFKNLLDRWEEPNDRRKTTDASISDILDFRRRLSLMDTPYPFSPYFGRAGTRDECIKSAKKTYRELMKLDPGASVLSFDVIELLAMDPNGNEDESKKRVLKRLFRPDRFNELSLLAFVQACDSVYKRLRFFRASVGNSSVIDRVLEQLIDVVFYFVLILLVLSVLELNPWTLLVSISTLLFSTAFAIGPSVSKYIEGVLLIVARRPYDLGDRVLIAGAEFPQKLNVSLSWFVEDINLFTTTLRFCNTNEVATVNNASLAAARIVNCNRSPNALVSLTLYFTDTATEEELSTFRETVESFVSDRPRIWDSVAFFRCESINQDLKMMEYTVRIRHTKSWQDAATIWMNKSELLKFAFQTGKKLGINYDSPPRASWTINSFASPPDGISSELEGALGALGKDGDDDDDDENDADVQMAGTLEQKQAWFHGKAKGMRSLEQQRTRIGGDFSFNH